MKRRLLSIPVILLLSLGLVTAVLAAANTAQQSLADLSGNFMQPEAYNQVIDASHSGTQQTIFQPTHLLAGKKSRLDTSNLKISVNYADDWLYAKTTPDTALTITVAGKATLYANTDGAGEYKGFEGGGVWDPGQPDIVPGDIITAETTAYTTTINPVGTIDGLINITTDILSGTIQAPFGTTLLDVRCAVWEDVAPAPIDISNVSADGGSFTCDFGAEGWDIQPGQHLAVFYYEPDNDEVINVFEPPWMRVNYAHDWAGGDYPAGHTMWITVTNGSGEIKATTQEVSDYHMGWEVDGFETKDDWTPGRPDIQTGDRVIFTSNNGYSNTVQVGVITGTVDGENDSVAGRVYADWLSSPLAIECQAWGSPKEAPNRNSSAGANGDPPYFCQWNPVSEWDIQPLQDVAVMYLEPDGDRVINVFQEPDMNMHLRVNYGHDWVEGQYESGHTVWITVTESDGVSIKATAQGETGVIPWWSGDQNTGFSTEYNVAWSSGERPDMQAGDWVYGRFDNGFSAVVHLGEINGTVDTINDSVAGTIDTPWFTQTLDIECLPWGASGDVPNKNSTAGPGGDPAYSCAWNHDTEWDILAGQDVGVAYIGSDGNWVANVLRAPAPHLWVNTWGDGNPAEGGNYILNIEYNNDGETEVAKAVISDTLQGGMSYISDTSGIPHTGTGAEGDPLVWQLGNLPNGPYSTRFMLFVEITAPASNTVTNTAHIGTSTEYFQSDADRKTSQWSGHIEANDTHLNVSKGAWTWAPVPGYDFVYNIATCNNGGTASSQVTLTDTLPLSTTLVSWWGQHPGWTEVVSAPHQLVVTRNSIPGGQCSEVYARVNLDSAAWRDMPITNTAIISASNDREADDNLAIFEHQAGGPHYNLSIYKDWNWGRLTPGGELDYEISYANNGSIPADDVHITSTLPANTTFVRSWYDDSNGSHPITPTLVVPGEYVVWDIGRLDNGYSGRISIQFSIDASAEPGATLTHTVAMPTLPVEDDFDDNRVTWVETLNPPGPNLRVTKQNYEWRDDHTLSYELRIHNLGTTTLENFWITDTYPVSTTFNDDWNVNHGGWYTLTVDKVNHQLIFWGERLDPDNTASLGFRVNLDDNQNGLAFTNHVSAPIQGDVYPEDNHDQVTAHTGPELYVDKSLADGDVLPGELITYSLKFGNDQKGNAGWWNLQGNAWLTETLPDDVEFVSSQILYCDDHIWCEFTPTTIEDNVVAWQLWPLSAGQHNELRVVVRISDDLDGLDTLHNEVEIASEQPGNDGEPSYANNHNNLESPVALPYFEIGKKYTSSKVAGMPVTYTLTVSNTGHEADTNVDVKDWTPSWMTYGGGGLYSAGWVTWTLPTLTPNHHATTWYTGTLSCTSGEVVNNQYYFVNDSDQGITSTYGAPVSFSILAPTIDVSAAASKTTIKPDGTAYFTATATTNGTPLTYRWAISNTLIGTGATFHYVFTTPGTYVVRATGADSCNYTDAYSITVTVDKRKIYLPWLKR